MKTFGSNHDQCLTAGLAHQSLTNTDNLPESTMVETLSELARLANYSFMDTLNADPDAQINGDNHLPRQVYSGHYVPVTPMKIENPEYIAHSKNFFRELGFSDSLA